jgi:hypothetical protein
MTLRQIALNLDDRLTLLTGKKEVFDISIKLAEIIGLMNMKLK